MDNMFSKNYFSLDKGAVPDWSSFHQDCGELSENNYSIMALQRRE
jgi:hypothetical protein